MEDAMAPPSSGSSIQMMLGDVMMPLWNGRVCWPSDDMLAVCPYRSAGFGSHLVLYLHIVFHRPDAEALVIWRWEEDERRWKSIYWEYLANFIVNRNLVQFKDLKVRDVVGVHPSRPEIVFLDCCCPFDTILECNMRTGNLQVFTDTRNWRTFFQPRFTCWPSPIPGYEKLQSMYDGQRSLTP
ncbi:unnamed protein product [Linum trigynum]|uniref:DUF1618 domain-containing protein n=1 Tax=Linum trigynum TaxID=586398 RepID=A0AAV2GFI9_9ROSI